MTVSAPASPQQAAITTAWVVILGTSVSHLLNDVIQSLITASYPVIEGEFGLTFWQIGLLTFAFQVTASILQPLVGHFGDKRPVPQALAIGMGMTLTGLVLLAEGPGYGWLIAGAR